MTMAPRDGTRRSFSPTSPSCLYKNVNSNNSSDVISSISSFPQRKTVAFAVNHERTIVGRHRSSSSSTFDTAKRNTGLTNENHFTDFIIPEQLLDIRDPSLHGTHSITDLHLRRSSSMEIQRNNVPDEIASSSSKADDDARASNATNVTSTTLPDGTMQPADPTTTRRRSTRDQKQRSIPVSTTRVRYDMELVPAVERNSSFWDSIQTWPPTILQAQDGTEKENQKLEASIKANIRTTTDENESATLDHDHVDMALLEHTSTNTLNTSTTSYVSTALTACTSDIQHLSPVPFFHKSVLWIPPSRKDWEDSVSELTAICTSAAYRRHDPCMVKTFHPPLSRVYIKDRVNIDDPLRGYQIRHSTGGWLQGFLLWTNFTTWTNYFTWDSLHPLSGLPSTSHAKDDAGGSLAKELQTLPRHGDSNDGGIVFDHVAEIALLGGLGCGELLLRMALEEIRNSPIRYQYIVLQATAGSRAFYERFGFVRVGAVCRYGTHSLMPKGMPPNTSQVSDLHPPEQGYRHWTHANESQQSLDLHGGPSYMMCLKLPVEDDTSVPKGNLMETMKQYQVFDKPVIQPLGNVTTPGRKVTMAAFPPAGLPGLSDTNLSTSSSPTKRASSRIKRNSTSRYSTTSYENTVHHSDTHASPVPPRKKRRKISEENFGFTNSLLPPLPQSGPNLISLPDSVAPGRNLRITIYPQKLLPPLQPLSSTTIPTVTPRENQNRLYTDERESPIATAVSIPMSAASNSTAPRPAHGRATWTAGKNADPAPARPKKATTTRQSRGTNNKKVGRPLKDSASNSNGAAVSPSKMGSTILSKNGSIMSQPSLPSMSSPQKQASEYMREHNAGTIFPIDKAVLCKQKVKSYPRDRVHFFNKVVRPTATTKCDPNFYFVLHYDDGGASTSSQLSSSSSSPKLTLIPMLATGLMSGKRAGRPRYQCVVLDTNANWTTDSADKYEAVPSFMVMKTPFVGQEAWDVLFGD